MEMYKTLNAHEHSMETEQWLDKSPVCEVFVMGGGLHIGDLLKNKKKHTLYITRQVAY